MKTAILILGLFTPVSAQDFGQGLEIPSILANAQSAAVQPLTGIPIGVPIVPTARDGRNQALQHLLSLRQEHLDSLYSSQEAGPIPSGDARGRATFFPGDGLLGKISQVAKALFWQGKFFDLENGTVINKILGFKAIKARVYLGKSKLDSRPAIIIDYSETSRIASRVTDEIRQVAPQIYLGRAYLATPFGELHILNFALDFRH